MGLQRYSRCCVYTLSTTSPPTSQIKTSRRANLADIDLIQTFWAGSGVENCITSRNIYVLPVLIYRATVRSLKWPHGPQVRVFKHVSISYYTY